jgi:hypothetical protein
MTKAGSCRSCMPGARSSAVCRYSAGQDFAVSHLKSRNLGSALAAPSGQSGKRLGRDAGPRQKSGQEPLPGRLSARSWSSLRNAGVRCSSHLSGTTTPMAL